MKKKLQDFFSGQSKSPHRITTILMILFSLSVLVTISSGAIIGWLFDDPLFGAAIAFVLMIFYILIKQLIKR